MNHPQAPKKQTQFKPNFRKAKMNLKSLAGKSGHTPYLPRGFFCCELSPKEAKISPSAESTCEGQLNR